MNKHCISAYGKSINTQYWEKITESELEHFRELYYQKPKFEEVQKEILSAYYNGATKNSKINKYYVFDLMTKVLVYNCKWTVEEVFNNKDLLGIFISKIHNQNIYKCSKDTDIIKLATAIRIGGSGLSRLPTKYPIQSVDYILFKYNVNNNYYDYSCGWGDRLFSALKNNVNYYGTDPNYILTERLQQFVKDWNNTIPQTFLPNTNVSIRTTGSEILHKNMIGKIGLAFSSPPYFMLEDYKIGNQSCNKNTEYSSWLENYWRKTVKNIYQYLIDDGYFLVNIKNYNKFKLEEDTQKIAEEENFELINIETLDNMLRPNYYQLNIKENQEKIRVFKKRK